MLSKIEQFMRDVTMALQDYREEVNKLAERFSKEQQNAERIIEENRDKWTPQYQQEYRDKIDKSVESYSPRLNAERERASRKVTAAIKGIEDLIEQYFTEPASEAFVQSITAISAIGLALSDTEFAVLARRANSYIEKRLLNQLAQIRARTVDGVTLKDGVQVHTINEVSQPYNGIKLPDITGVYNELRNYEEAVNRFLSRYAGKNAELVDVTSESGREEDINIALGLTADAFFRNNATGKLKDVLIRNTPELFDTLPLDEEEREIIDSIVTPKAEMYPHIIGATVREAASTSTLLKKLLLRDERYSNYLGSIEE